MNNVLHNHRFVFAKLIFVVFLFCSFSHPFYLGVTDLKYNSKEKSVQGSVKLFTNDLEDALKKVYKVQIDLINGKDKNSLNKILNDYLKNHLKIKINSKPVTFDMIGFEHESEAVWMYVEILNAALPKKVEIENTLLYDQVKSQINIVHFEVNGNTKSSKVSNPDKNIVFEF
ncbi:MAG: DUF6702 family protein [Bacteroidia bacterium]